jgi:hypothetical protein
MRYLIFISIINFLFTQEILDRLIVPIYYQFNFSSGYDSNIFSYSNKEIENKEVGSGTLGKIKYYDSDYHSPQFKLIYSPVLLDQYETNFIIQLKNKIYRTYSLKNTISTSSKFEIKFGSYHWLKIGYMFSPNNYVKRFQDVDISSNEYFDCEYSQSKGFISYSVPLNKKNWTRISWEISDYFYNPHFTEFDTRSHEFNWYLSHKLNKKVRYGMTVGIGDGNNISFANGLISTEQDRSFRTAHLKFSRSQYGFKLLGISKLYSSYSLDYRSYLNEFIDDPLHSGRIHYDHQIYTSITKKINSNLSMNGFVKYRFRQTFSEFQWVEDLKSFNKVDFGIKLTWKGVYDIYR